MRLMKSLQRKLRPQRLSVIFREAIPVRLRSREIQLLIVFRAQRSAYSPHPGCFEQFLPAPGRVFAGRPAKRTSPAGSVIRRRCSLPSGSAAV